MICPKCNRVVSDQHVFCSYCGNQLREGTQTASVSHNIQDKKRNNKNTFLLLLSGLNLFVFLPYGLFLIFSFSLTAAFFTENVSFLSSNFWDYFLIIACLAYFIGSILFFTSSVRKSLSETKVVKSEKAKRNEKIATIILFIIVIIIITWIWILSDHFRLFFNLVS